MTYSIQRAVSDGTMTRIDISIEYFDEAEISVLVAGVVTSAWHFIPGANAILLDTAPAAGVEVTIVRSTDRSGLRHVYSTGASFNAPTLDESLKQTLHIAQEALEQGLSGDYFQDINMHGYRITSLGRGFAPGDAVNMEQLDEVVPVLNVMRTYSSYAAAVAGATKLADGQLVQSPDVLGIPALYVVQSGALVFRDYAPSGASVPTFAALRAYTGQSTEVLLTDLKAFGRFKHVPGSSAPDDGGLTIVGLDGRRWVRAGSAVMASVTPEMFGASGDGVRDDGPEIQKALDSKRSVVLANKYRMTGTRTVHGQRVTGTGVTINSGTWAMTTIIADGNFTAFVPAADSPVAADISNLFVWYGDTTPMLPTGNDQKTGFAFLNPLFPNPGMDANPQFTKISNCLVKGGWRAYDASGGAYLFKLERVWSWSCRFGFRHLGGTTLNMDTCYALFGEQAYFIQGVVNFTFNNCAMDRMVVTTTTPQRSAAVFANIPGMNFSSFYSELNEVHVDEGSLVMFIDCVGQVTAMAPWRDSLSCAAGQEVYGYRVYGGRLRFVGCVPQVVGDGLTFAGNGQVFGVLAQAGAQVTLDTSVFQAPTGGTPLARASAMALGGAVIYKHASDLSGGTDMSISIIPDDGTWFTPELRDFTIVGTPIVSGNIRKAGKLTFLTINIDPNGGSIASVPGTSYIPDLPVVAVGTAVASVVNGAYAGGHGRIIASQLTMPYLDASPTPITIHAVIPTA